MNNQKGIVPIIIVLIVVTLLSGGILAYQYWWISRQEVEMPEIELPKREASEEVEVPADWKIYKNEEYGFEIKYPPEYDVDDQSRWQDKKPLAIIGHFPNGFSISISDSPAIFYYPEGGGFIYGSKIEDMYREYEFDFDKRIKKRKINNVSFTIAYGVIWNEYRYVDAITQDPSHKYYVVLQQAGEIEELPPGLWENLHCMPDEAEEWIINRSFEWIIRKMIEEEYEDVVTFNKILSTFRFLE